MERDRSIRSLAWVLGSLALGCVPPPEPVRSDLPGTLDAVRSIPEETRLRFAKISRALVLYRESYPAKAPAEWRTYRDAGLPFSLHNLTEPGHVWSLARYDIYPVIGFSEARAITWDVPFSTTYLAFAQLPPVEQARAWKRKGTRQILACDFLYDRDTRSRRTLVLRYDGTIEEVTYDATKPFDLAFR